MLAYFHKYKNTATQKCWYTMNSIPYYEQRYEMGVKTINRISLPKTSI